LKFAEKLHEIRSLSEYLRLTIERRLAGFGYIREDAARPGQLADGVKRGERRAAFGGMLGSLPPEPRLTQRNSQPWLWDHGRLMTEVL
jgi:hypothetical protein